jgi:ABC-2 type transport system permease protein
MPPDATLTRFVARRTARSGALWGVVFGAAVATTASGYALSFPTAASRARLAVSIGTNAGIAALLGRPHHLDTVAGFTAWRTLGVLTIIGAVWGLLTATRVSRGEEDAGRWELLLAGPTTRGRAAWALTAGLTAGLITLWGVTAALTVADGTTARVHLGISAALFLAAALVAGAAEFLAIGLLVAEVAASRRAANLVGAGVLGASFLLRMVADSSRSLQWLGWLSPLGWIERLRPLTGTRLGPAVPIAALAVVSVTTAAVLAGRRDLGSGVLASTDVAASRTALSNGVGSLTFRLGRTTMAAWVAALAICGLVFGLVAQSAANAVSGSATIARAIARLGGHLSGAASYLGVTFLIVAGLVAFAAAGQVAACRAEEAAGHVEQLLVRPVSRRRWLVGRLLMAGVFVVMASTVSGVLAWAGAASQPGGVGLGVLAQAGLNTAPPALFVLGVGALVFGTRPRLAPAFVYAVVAWSFLIEFIASIVTTNRWLLDSSLFHHMMPAPAASPNWNSALALAGLGVLAAASGVEAFQRRDLIGP